MIHAADCQWPGHAVARVAAFYTNTTGPAAAVTRAHESRCQSLMGFKLFIAHARRLCNILVNNQKTSRLGLSESFRLAAHRASTRTQSGRHAGAARWAGHTFCKAAGQGQAQALHRTLFSATYGDFPVRPWYRF